MTDNLKEFLEIRGIKYVSHTETINYIFVTGIVSDMYDLSGFVEPVINYKTKEIQLCISYPSAKHNDIIKKY